MRRGREPWGRGLGRGSEMAAGVELLVDTCPVHCAYPLAARAGSSPSALAQAPQLHTPSRDPLHPEAWYLLLTKVALRKKQKKDPKREKGLFAQPSGTSTPWDQPSLCFGGLESPRYLLLPRHPLGENGPQTPHLVPGNTDTWELGLCPDVRPPTHPSVTWGMVQRLPPGPASRELRTRQVERAQGGWGSSVWKGAQLTHALQLMQGEARGDSPAKTEVTAGRGHGVYVQLGRLRATAERRQGKRSTGWEKASQDLALRRSLGPHCPS